MRMAIELNRATFRRLVQLNWLTLAAIIPIAAWQALSQGWNDFDAAFTKLLGDTYGYSEPSEWMQWTFVVLFVIHIAGAIGVYWFQKWARLALWLPIIVVAAADTALGLAATYEPTVQAWFLTFSDAVWGAVVFASYCRPVASAFSGEARSGDHV